MDCPQSSQMDSLIPAEIKHDEFYVMIQQIAQREDIQSILEIGSSSGEGSTDAFVTGLRHNRVKPSLFCMEVSQVRFAALRDRYQTDDFVKPYNVSSVSLEAFASANEVSDFYNNTSSNLNVYPLHQVLDWLRQDTNYVSGAGVGDRGIQIIKQENKIDVFDVVLIDGSEFTGQAELDEIYGAKIILLDDISTFKNYHNHHRLLKDPSYVLVHYNLNLRHGFSIFFRSDIHDRNEVIRNSMSESAEKSLVTHLVKPGMTVFDVGANIGNYSLLLSELVGNTGKVYAFEPTTSTFETLQKRLTTVNQATALQKAVYSENTQIEFNEFPDEYSEWNSIGKPQMLNPKNANEYVPLVKSEIVEAIALDSFCAEQKIQAIDFLKIDVEGAESDVLKGALTLLKHQKISFIQFEISQKMLEGLNRTAKDTFDLLIENGYECHTIQDDGEIGVHVIDSQSFYQNFIAFPTLPVHFFTIVLNGEPFIRYHVDLFNQLTFPWHWHIVEGVADLKHDTAWSVKLGGHVSDRFHNNGCSIDGTSAYLDELQQRYPDNITVYRQPSGSFWDGKRAMVNAPLKNIQEACLLWQVDADELWTVDQIDAARLLFVANPDRTAAFYWCWYFVGEDLVISTRNCYTQNPQQDWLRTWRYQPGYEWASHEPPRLVEALPDGGWRDVALINPFRQDETEAKQLVFQHFAYVTPAQLQFKEQYYGYEGAIAHWQQLQQSQFPVRLRQYFPWVGDLTMVDKAAALGITPIAQQLAEGWQFFRESPTAAPTASAIAPVIVVDGAVFQVYKTEIARVWKSILSEWVASGFAQSVVLLDRGGTAPDISGIRYHLTAPFNAQALEAEQALLQSVCDELGADVFISTYFTTPASIPTVAMVYDMIPEVMGESAHHPIVRMKRQAIAAASDYIAISQNTAADVAKLIPDLQQSIKVAHCGVSADFTPASEAAIAQFRRKYGITKPYFVVMSADNASLYKNNEFFFQAFAKLPSKDGFELVCTVFEPTLPDGWRNYTAGSTVHLLKLSDAELAIAYAGAIALVYPSRYEGFGMPPLEAIACGCPVITSPNASLPEVMGEAALYIDSDDLTGLVDALCEVQKPSVRHRLREEGLARSAQFSWSKMAQTVADVLIDQTLAFLNLRSTNILVFVDWNQPEEALYEQLGGAIAALLTHPDPSKMSLIIDVSTLPEDIDLNFLLGDIAMGVLLEAELDIETSGISALTKLSPLQWNRLAASVQGYVQIGDGKAGAIAEATQRQIPEWRNG